LGRRAARAARRPNALITMRGAPEAGGRRAARPLSVPHKPWSGLGCAPRRATLARPPGAPGHGAFVRLGWRLLLSLSLSLPPSIECCCCRCCCRPSRRRRVPPRAAWNAAAAVAAAAAAAIAVLWGRGAAPARGTWLDRVPRAPSRPYPVHTHTRIRTHPPTHRRHALFACALACERGPGIHLSLLQGSTHTPHFVVLRRAASCTPRLRPPCRAEFAAPPNCTCIYCRPARRPILYKRLLHPLHRPEKSGHSPFL
jgi:hypothetical protein